MDALAYPIGKFMPVDQPALEQRETWIVQIEQMSGIVRSAVQNLTLEQLSAPYRPGGWNVQQVVHHMADNDMNAYIRFKRALTEETPTAGTYREDLWAELIDYQIVPVETSLLLLEALHKRFAVLLRNLSPDDFKRSFISPTHGNMTLEVAVQRYVWHNRHHIAQITSLKKRMGWE